ncbi:MAG TPA: PadR family transcriptional regulator [Ktedonobacterales bacterium]
MPAVKGTQQETGDPQAFLPLTPAIFHILLALADGERHGYSIMREVEAYTNGQLKLGPTTLYRSIRQMLAAGLIVESDERPDPALDDERRRYYRLSDLGRRVALAEMQRLDRLMAVARAKRLSLSQTAPGVNTAMGGL